MTLTAAPAIARRRPTALPWLLRVAAVSCLFGAEAIQTAVIDEHINEWLPYGLFFLALSVAEGMLAVALITAPSQWVTRIAIGVSLGTVALWLLTRTLGLPLGPMAWSPEPIGRADTIATFLGLMTAAVLFAAARVTTATTVTRRKALDYVRAALIVSAVVAIATFGATGG